VATDPVFQTTSKVINLPISRILQGVTRVVCLSAITNHLLHCLWAPLRDDSQLWSTALSHPQRRPNFRRSLLEIYVTRNEVSDAAGRDGHDLLGVKRIRILTTDRE